MRLPVPPPVQIAKQRGQEKMNKNLPGQLRINQPNYK